MASGLYDSAREGFLTGAIDWATDDIRVILVDADDYTVNFATHEFLEDVPSAARVATSTSLAGKTTAGGVADADDVTFPAVTGDEAEALIIYQHTGSESTARLIAYLDSFPPVTPNGGDIEVIWDSGSNRIFRI